MTIQIPEGVPADRARVYDLALREELAAAVGVEVAALDRESALATLERADDVRAVFQTLDGARFADGVLPDDILERVRKAIKVLA